MQQCNPMPNGYFISCFCTNCITEQVFLSLDQIQSLIGTSDMFKSLTIFEKSWNGFAFRWCLMVEFAKSTTKSNQNIKIQDGIASRAQKKSQKRKERTKFLEQLKSTKLRPNQPAVKHTNTHVVHHDHSYDGCESKED
jgi:hypothetical protein